MCLEFLCEKDRAKEDPTFGKPNLLITGTAIRYNQYQRQEIWPQIISTNSNDVLSEAVFTDGTIFKGGYKSLFLRFEENFYGSNLFWYPLHKYSQNNQFHEDSLAAEMSPNFKNHEVNAIYAAVAKYCDPHIARKTRSYRLPFIEEARFSASEDFKNINWHDNVYVLKGHAAEILEMLYFAKKRGLPGMHKREIFSNLYPEDSGVMPPPRGRIQFYFRRGDAKRLWDDGLIDHDKKGNYSLNIEIKAPAH